MFLNSGRLRRCFRMGSKVWAWVCTLIWPDGETLMAFVTCHNIGIPESSDAVELEKKRPSTKHDPHRRPLFRFPGSSIRDSPSLQTTKLVRTMHYVMPYWCPQNALEAHYSPPYHTSLILAQEFSSFRWDNSFAWAGTRGNLLKTRIYIVCPVFQTRYCSGMVLGGVYLPLHSGSYPDRTCTRSLF